MLITKSIELRGKIVEVDKLSKSSHKRVLPYSFMFSLKLFKDILKLRLS